MSTSVKWPPTRFGKQWISRQTLLSTTALLIWPGLIDVVLHLTVATNYGYFRDELYYLISGRHLSFGYVERGDQNGIQRLLNTLITHLC
jgi:hypothetical protein